MSDTAPRVDLRPDHWRIVRTVLHRHLPMRRVVAFGSRATWTAKEYSDLDLAVLGDEPLPLDSAAALAEGFGESDLPFKVDVVAWADIDDHLRDIIRRDAVDVQTPEAGPASTPGTPSCADRLHLSARHRRVLEALLREHLPDVEAWACCSRVNGRRRTGSDLDLVLRGPGLEKIPAEQLAGFADAVRESTIPFLVEAKDWTRLSERFRREIEQTHYVLMPKPSTVNHPPPHPHEVSPSDSSDRSTSSLEEMCELIVDCPHFTPEWTDHGYLVIRNQNIRNGRLDLSNPSFTHIDDFERRVKRARPRPGDIVFTREAPMGEVCRLPEDLECCVGQRQVLLRPGNDVDGTYLFYALQSPFVRRRIFWNEGTGSTVSNVRIPVLKALLIPRLGSGERFVAQCLGALDDKIELNRRMNETLEAMARALFKSWFVDFEPVKAKIAGGHLPFPRMVSDLFPDRLVESSVGMVPSGWHISEIGKEVTAVGGATPSTKEAAFWTPGEHAWATPKDLSALTAPALLDTAKKVTSTGLATISSGLLPWGTVLMSSRAPIGYLAIAEMPVAVNQGFIAMVCQQRLPNLYVLFWCRENLPYIRNIAGGSTFAEISKKSFRPIPVLVPPPNALDSFSRLVGPLYDRIVGNVRHTTRLIGVRNLLLPSLISGEIPVPQAEKVLEKSL